MTASRLITIGGVLFFCACSGGGGGGGPTAGSSPGGNAELLVVHQGRIVDVYGLRNISGELTFSLFRTDVLIGPDIEDQRDSVENKPDQDVIYDFISANPGNLQPRLFIPRDVDSVEFGLAFQALDNNAREVSRAKFGQSTADAPFSVIPRNAGLRLTFAEGLGIENDFFIERDEDGTILGVRNAEAVQLLKIVGDPTDAIDVGDFQVIPARIALSEDTFGRAVDTHQVIIDPVLLGTEGLEYQTRNNASGMPEAPDQIGANIRIAVALEGPLRIRGIREDKLGNLSGFNNAGRLSVIRDARSGNRLDDFPEISRGFIRDPIPPRIVGQIQTYLEQVDDVDDLTQEVTLFKNGAIHEIDRGDTLRFLDVRTGTGILVAATEVVVDPMDDRGSPGIQHVRVRIRRVPKVTNDQGQVIDPLEILDPSNDPDYPQDLDEREAWLVANAARAILVAEFTASRFDSASGKMVRDDPRNFITFSPSPLPDADGIPSESNQNVSPFAGAIIRFTKPVDLTTVNSTDSFYFATRDLLDPDEVQAFKAEGGRGPGTPAIDPSTFNLQKFRTPHLVASRLFDEDGSQTALRLQPILGFYLDGKMRADEDLAFEDKKYRYFLHVLSGREGITDLSGNPIDLQAEGLDENEQIVIPFSLDTRMRSSLDPVFANNIVASIVRTFNDPDEDEKPSYYSNSEIQTAGGPTVAAAYTVPDIFGAVTYLPDGTLLARPTSRIRKVVDNLNQPTAPSQSTDFRWCPQNAWGGGFFGRESQVASNSAGTPFGAGIQNPLNPFGCRLQTVWREIDMGLSRVDPFDFNLDVEQMYWAPFRGRAITFDEFDRVSLFLGHAENRPEPCVGATSSLPFAPNSGVSFVFADNYVNNRTIGGKEKESTPAPHAAYVDETLVIDPNSAFNEPNGINRYLPLPTFQKPYFVWRDETVLEQGGMTSAGKDVKRARQPDFKDYILSPFLGGLGNKATAASGTVKFNQGTWTNSRNYKLESVSQSDLATGGLVGAIALPLLADFWTYCDSPSLPEFNGYVAAGVNGWQISITVQSSPNPAFRAYSAGFAGFGDRPAECVDPSSPKWGVSLGGFTPQGATTNGRDNSLYWIMADFLKRSTVVTAGFVEITNPHRIPFFKNIDPRLGPYFRPANTLPTFVHEFQPPLEDLPGGTSIVAEFRGASIVDPVDLQANSNSGPWRAFEDGYFPAPNFVNFALDPLKAGDAHIRKFDDRPSSFTGGASRNWWTYFYNRTVTTYTENLNTLMDPVFTTGFDGPLESFLPKDVKYFNWRFLMNNNVEASPSISPSIDTFMVSYRFDKVR